MVAVMVSIFAVGWALMPSQSDRGPRRAETSVRDVVWAPAVASSGAATATSALLDTTVAIVSPAAHSEHPHSAAHSESEPVVKPLWSATPLDTPAQMVERLVDAVAVRLRAELTGEGRDAFPSVSWVEPPCCDWVEVTGVVADFSGSGAVRVLVEWETDVALGGGVSYWAVDDAGGWSLATGEPAP